MMDEEPRAIYTHCYGHALNLAIGDAVKGRSVMKDALQVTHEITKLLKFSPRRDAIFDKVKKELAPDSMGLMSYVPQDGLLEQKHCPVYWQIMKY